MVEREVNRARLREASIVIWLRADLDLLALRLEQGPPRPRLTTLAPRAELTDVATRRAPWYAAVSSWSVDVDGRTPDQVASCIAQALLAREGT